MRGRWREDDDSRLAWPTALVLGLAASLAAALVPARAMLIGYVPSNLRQPFRYGIEMLIAAGHDVAFVAAIASPFALVAVLTCRRRPLATAVVTTFSLCGLVTLLWGLANIMIVRQLGHPFNYAFLYYSDFLRSEEAHGAIAAGLSPRAATITAGIVAGWLVGGAVAAAALRAMTPWVRGRHLALSLVPALVVYLVFSHWFLVAQQWGAERTANPVYWFGRSVIASRNMPRLFTQPTPIGPEDFQTFAQRGHVAWPSLQLPGGALRPDAPRPRNVILFVHESTGARFLDLYASPHDVTPHLKRYLDRAVLFEKAYANTPATNHSMVAMLCSAYPLLSYKSITAERPDIPLASLPQVLRDAGYRTGLFSAGNMNFQGAREFLAHRGFDLAEDAQTRGSDAMTLVSAWEYCSGSDEQTTVRSMIRWIDARRDRPFFATYWSLQAHYPYFVVGQSEHDCGHGEDFDRYLGAIEQTDAAFGELMAYLEQTGQLDDTLVVVVGDHGEGFLQHGGLKSRRLYEENLHVPLVFIADGLFTGQRDAGLVGMIDLPPSILHILGLPPPDDWQGRSVFGGDRLDRVYFCATWSDWMFGMRQGPIKLVLNASTGAAEVYDVEADPEEVRNLAAESGEFVRRATNRLAAWAQYQHDYYEGYARRPAVATTAPPPSDGMADAAATP